MLPARDSALNPKQTAAAQKNSMAKGNKGRVPQKNVIENILLRDAMKAVTNSSAKNQRVGLPGRFFMWTDKRWGRHLNSIENDELERFSN